MRGSVTAYSLLNSDFLYHTGSFPLEKETNKQTKTKPKTFCNITGNAGPKTQLKFENISQKGREPLF